MECVSYTIEPEVPPDFSTASTCSTAFFRVASSLDQLDGKEAVRKHTIHHQPRTPGGGGGGKVQRSAPSPKDVTKIVVHHDFEPLQLYIVLLCSSGTAVLLAYHDLKVLEKWRDVKDVTSADFTVTGTPQLILTKLNGKAVVIPNAKLMSYAHGDNLERMEEEREEKEDATGKKEVVQALMHRFKGGVKLAEQRRIERKMKEDFITEELAVLQSQLQGQLDMKEKSLVPALNVEERKAEQKSVPPLYPNPLKVQQVYHKLVHDKWVIGVNVINDGERMLVSQLDLILCCGEVPLCHTSQVLKTVKHIKLHGDTDVRVTIDYLNPPVLRPRKKATVFGVCEVPSFETGPSVLCSGLLSYYCSPLKIVSTQSLKPNNERQIQKYQVSVPLVELKASELHSLASLELRNFTNTECVSFSTVALVAASRCTQVSLTSLVSPLNTFITKISCRLKLIKVSGVSDFYVLHPGESHPLQHTGFTLHPVDSHNLHLNLYSKDEKQALVLAHTLLAALPEDASMQFLDGPKDTDSSVIQPLNLHHMLLARMREAATYVTDGLEANSAATRSQG